MFYEKTVHFVLYPLSYFMQTWNQVIWLSSPVGNQRLSKAEKS